MYMLKQMSVTVVKAFSYLLEIQNRAIFWRAKDLYSERSLENLQQP